MRHSRIGFGLVAVFAVLVIGGIACTNYQIPGSGGGGEVGENTCEGCHTDYERLMAVHSPDTAPPPGGCGGDRQDRQGA